MTDYLVEMGSEILFLGARAGHYASEGIIWLVGESEQITSFGQHERFVYVRFQMHRLHHAEFLCCFNIVGHAKRAIEAGDRLQPRVPKHIRVP
jgi:hypothetical protein